MKSCRLPQGIIKPLERCGFTLLEVMVAVSILAIGLSVLFGSQSRSLSYATEARFNTVAPMLASGKFAEFENDLVFEGTDEGDFGEEYPGFAWELNVERANLDEMEELRGLDPPLLKAELTVIWSDTKFRYTLVNFGQWGE